MAAETLNQHREALVALAERLIKEETLEGEALAKLLALPVSEPEPVAAAT